MFCRFCDWLCPGIPWGVTGKTKVQLVQPAFRAMNPVSFKNLCFNYFNCLLASFLPSSSTLMFASTSFPDVLKPYKYSKPAFISLAKKENQVKSHEYTQVTAYYRFKKSWTIGLRNMILGGDTTRDQLDRPPTGRRINFGPQMAYPSAAVGVACGFLGTTLINPGRPPCSSLCKGQSSLS